jgi:hypothetical protein
MVIVTRIRIAWATLYVAVTSRGVVMMTLMTAAIVGGERALKEAITLASGMEICAMGVRAASTSRRTATGREAALGRERATPANM